jgi:MoaA/NifB/PqqE/SkfB family radical SAM enzyme
VDAIGLNHLMFSTPEEVAETVRLTGASDASAISTFVTADPGVDAARVKRQVDALVAKCAAHNIRFDMRPKVRPAIVDQYYTPGAALEGRCLYPFLYARVSFSGKVYFCPFIRVEVGDLTSQSLEEVWTGERYVSLRKKLVETGIFPVCRRCCKVELAPVAPEATADERQDVPDAVLAG